MKDYKQQHKIYTKRGGGVGVWRFILLHLEIMFQKLEISTPEKLDFLK